MSQPNQPVERLTWRMDPKQSLSDWKIEVVVSGENEDPCSNVYHVHQCVLAVGHKKSNFFVKLFCGPFSESVTKSSCMEFEQEVADAFPILLDYLYSHEDKLDVTTENIPVLMKLADYLDIQSVRDEIAKYCLKNLGTQTCAIFYGYGEDYKILSLQEAAIDICLINLEAICPDSSSIASDSRLTFWLELQKHMKNAFDEYLLHFSRLVAAFCFCNKATLNIDDFKALTSSKDLPQIHYKAAELLIQVELELENHNATELSDLQERCIDALATAWEVHTLSMEPLVHLSPLVLSALMKKITDNAKDEISQLRQQRKKCRHCKKWNH